MNPGIPWHARLRGRLISSFWPGRYRAFWVRYWESQGISEEEQMQLVAEAEESERLRRSDDDQP